MQGYWHVNGHHCLDVRGVELPDTLQTYRTIKAAKQVMHDRGYNPCHIYEMANRFNRFVIFGTWVDYGKTIRCAAKTPGETVVITLRDGRISSDQYPACKEE